MLIAFNNIGKLVQNFGKMTRRTTMPNLYKKDYTDHNSYYF